MLPSLQWYCMCPFQAPPCCALSTCCGILGPRSTRASVLPIDRVWWNAARHAPTSWTPGLPLEANLTVLCPLGTARDQARRRLRKRTLLFVWPEINSGPFFQARAHTSFYVAPGLRRFTWTRNCVCAMRTFRQTGNGPRPRHSLPSVLPQSYTILTVQTSALTHRNDASHSLTRHARCGLSLCARRVRQATAPLSNLDPDLCCV